MFYIKASSHYHKALSKQASPSREKADIRISIMNSKACLNLFNIPVVTSVSQAPFTLKHSSTLNICNNDFAYSCRHIECMTPHKPRVAGSAGGVASEGRLVGKSHTDFGFISGLSAPWHWQISNVHRFLGPVKLNQNFMVAIWSVCWLDQFFFINHASVGLAQLHNLISRLSHCSVFDCLQYAKMEGEGLVHFIVWMTSMST